jgi:hypothetical protein
VEADHQVRWHIRVAVANNHKGAYLQPEISSKRVHSRRIYVETKRSVHRIFMTFIALICGD